ncbi:MAG TPA: hypothetical protein VFT43_14325, partial [Candidatus Polarisedimenticolia bacterium]|nr:hypothetical protein [Candidatus Polarisedimenticolia bacterium]
ALAAATVSGIEGLMSFAPLPLSRRCLFLAGPPGAGKTTTAAKLAGHLVLSSRRPVILAAADMERAGALEQASLLALEVGATLRSVKRPEDLDGAFLAAGEQGAVLVDTPGIGEGDPDRLERLRLLCARAPGSALALLLPAGLHSEDAARVVRRFALLRPTCAAFTKVDDALRPGDLVTALAGTRLPLAFMTNGQRVPRDFEPASPLRLAALLLAAGRRPERPAEAAR